MLLFGHTKGLSQHFKPVGVVHLHAVHLVADGRVLTAHWGEREERGRRGEEEEEEEEEGGGEGGGKFVMISIATSYSLKQS